MNILLVVIGKTDDRYIEDGIKKYADRIQHFVRFDTKVIPDLKNRKSLSEEQQKKAEGALLLSQVADSDTFVLLDENGKEKTSRQFADFVGNQMNTSAKRLVFAIGGPYGFSDDVYARATEKISLSQMTFSHQMVRLIFAEQLYRAFAILKNIPYHHD